MINTCPYCGFTPLAGKMVCPECGREIKENIAHKLQDIDEKNRKNNDSIAWNEFQDVSLGALMDHLENNSESNEATEAVTDEEVSVDTTAETSEEVSEFEKEESPVEIDEAETDHLADNPILSAYIKRHREGKEEEGPTLEELVAAQQAAAQEKMATEMPNAAEEEGPEKTADIDDTDATAEETAEFPPMARATPEASFSSENAPAETAVPVVAESQSSEVVGNSPESESQESSPEEDEEVTAVMTASPETEGVAPLGSNSGGTGTNEEVAEPAGMKAMPLQESKMATTTDEDQITPEVTKVDPPLAETNSEPPVVQDSNAGDDSHDSVNDETIAFNSQSGITEEEPSSEVKNNQRKKWPMVLAAAVVLAAGGGAFAYHEYQVDQEQKLAQAQALATEFKDLKKAVAGLYLDDDKEYLKVGLTNDEISAVQKKVAAFSDTAKAQNLKAELTEIQEKLALQNQVNELYTKPVISGDELAKDVPIASTEKIALTIDGTAPFEQLLAAGVQGAQDQLDQLNNAKAAMTPLVKDGKAIAEPKEADYQAAQKLVAELLASDEKNELTKQLKLVETKINENKAAAKAAAEKAAQEKAAQEKAAAEKAAQEQAAKEAAATTSNLPAEASPNMQPNSANQPILATDAADVADSSNPAWTWSSGVLEKVLATCIQRGYIVDGGYKLEKVRIENGEGYYNLYATTNQAPLTANYKASDLPLYLVTINCKTGYFRGNGNDHTIR